MHSFIRSDRYACSGLFEFRVSVAWSPDLEFRFPGDGEMVAIIEKAVALFAAQRPPFRADYRGLEMAHKGAWLNVTCSRLRDDLIELWIGYERLFEAWEEDEWLVDEDDWAGGPLRGPRHRVN